MSIQTCARDQRKMMQVIDQIKVLANNLDDLREEIGTLRNNYLANNEKTLTKKKIERPYILYKLGKSIKTTGLTFPGNGKRPAKETEISCHHSIQEASLFSTLKYMFHFGKKKEALQIPYSKDGSSQTDQLSNKNNSSRRLDKTTSPQKQLNDYRNFSEISCELDTHVIDSTLDVRAVRAKNSAQGKELCLLDDDKSLTTVCTQTDSQTPRRNRKSFNFYSKRPNFYFSKIKNAVITKKIIRNPSESTFTVCGRVVLENYPDLNKQNYGDSFRTKGNDNIEAISRENSFVLNNDVRRLRNKLPLIENHVEENSTTEEESEVTSSTSISLNLEVDVSDSSGKLEEYHPQRKPRTYTIRKPSGKHTQNSRYEKTPYVDQTSGLTLSSHGLSA
ncbi:uncharacterized protein LOC143359543 [Halictus rubicundus]|uniref:uncharacterized protein LOC143359543 n=1 Tax=Halictus rubicundus TaxID=77578 RepID=UPI004035B828